MSENGEIYSAGKNFTLPPAVTALTNLTSGWASGAFVVALFLISGNRLQEECIIAPMF